MIEQMILERFCTLLTEKTGIIPLASHKQGISSFLEKKHSEFTPEQNFLSYYNVLLVDSHEMELFINAATVNETYFFREESQFAFLKKDVLPYWKIMNPGKKLKMWSAASSSGEEAYSLALLALSMGIVPEITATDIDTEVLAKCAEGTYTKNSIRVHDGIMFHPLLSAYTKNDGRIVFPKEVKQFVSPKRFNLMDAGKNLFSPMGQDIIFIRNVFIYFSPEVKKTILAGLAKSLNQGGYLFVSMNEIASLDSAIMPPDLVKECSGRVFFFKKL